MKDIKDISKRSYVLRNAGKAGSLTLLVRNVIWKQFTMYLTTWKYFILDTEENAVYGCANVDGSVGCATNFTTGIRQCFCSTDLCNTLDFKVYNSG